MKKGVFAYFFAHWHPTAQASSQPDDFSYKGFEGQIFLQHYTPQDSFQLGNTRACRKNRGEKEN